jgi:excisionase family DNA binding protein
MSKEIPVVNSVERAVPIDPSHILTLAEISARLKVSERWVYEKTRHRCRNPLPSIRIGRFLRFHWLDVSAWLRQQSTMRLPVGDVQS